MQANMTTGAQEDTMEVDKTEEKLKALNISAKKQVAPVSEDAPIVLLVMGMAGSGKTTFVHVSRLYWLNFDFVASHLLLESIRKKVLQHQFGPCCTAGALPKQYRHP